MEQLLLPFLICQATLERKTLCNAFEVEWKNIVSISCGDVHTVGLRTDGTVIATGRNNYNQCDTSSWRDIIDISCSTEYYYWPEERWHYYNNW